MNKQDFLNALRAALCNELGTGATEEHVRYYEEYISSQVRMGKSEEEVLEELGNPKLIAKSILDAKSQSGGQRNYGGEAGTAEDYNRENYRQGTNGRAESFQSGHRSVRIQNKTVPLWLLITIIVLVVFVIFAALVMFVWWLAPLIITVWLVGFVIKMLRGRR